MYWHGAFSELTQLAGATQWHACTSHMPTSHNSDTFAAFTHVYSRPCTVLVHVRALPCIHYKHHYMYWYGAFSELTQLGGATHACTSHTSHNSDTFDAFTHVYSRLCTVLVHSRALLKMHTLQASLQCHVLV